MILAAVRRTWNVDSSTRANATCPVARRPPYDPQRGARARARGRRPASSSNTRMLRGGLERASALALARSPDLTIGPLRTVRSVLERLRGLGAQEEAVAWLDPMALVIEGVGRQADAPAASAEERFQLGSTPAAQSRPTAASSACRSPIGSWGWRSDCTIVRPAATLGCACASDVSVRPGPTSRSDVRLVLSATSVARPSAKRTG